MSAETKLRYVRFPLELKAEDDLIVGYANKAVVDTGGDYIPAEVWFEALRTFFREGMPVKLLHRPGLVVGKTVWLKITPEGLVLASRPLYPEVKGLIERGLLRAYSIGYVPTKVAHRADGVREIRGLDLYEVSYVDEPMNQECFFWGFMKMNMNHEVLFDPEKGVVSILGVTPEEMGQIAAAVKELLVKAGVPEDARLSAIEFKAAPASPDSLVVLPPKDPAPAEGTTDEEEEEDEEELDLDNVDWYEVLDVYYAMLDGREVPEEKAKWSRRYINRLPDSSFAVIEPAYERGETKDKNCRHLPHHGPGGGGTRNVNLDLPHLRNAFARANQIKPVTDSISTEELRRRAMEHLEHHRSALETYRDEEKGGPGLLERAKDLLRRIRGEAKEEPAEEKPTLDVKALEGRVQAVEGKLGDLEKALQGHGKELAELKEALNALVEVVQSIVPPQKSKTVVDNTGERKVSKWGLFVR